MLSYSLPLPPLHHPLSHPLPHPLTHPLSHPSVFIFLIVFTFFQNPICSCFQIESVSVMIKCYENLLFSLNLWDVLWSFMYCRCMEQSHLPVLTCTVTHMCRSYGYTLSLCNHLFLGFFFRHSGHLSPSLLTGMLWIKLNSCFLSGQKSDSAG